MNIVFVHDALGQQAGLGSAGWFCWSHLPSLLELQSSDGSAGDWHWLSAGHLFPYGGSSSRELAWTSSYGRNRARVGSECPQSKQLTDL